MAFELIVWWYGQGWLLLIHNVQRRLVRTSHLFSVPILVRTLFAPWRRIMTYPGASIGEHARALADNLVSRAVGLVVRLLVLVAAGVMLLGVCLAGIIEIIAWPLVPLAVVGAVVKGITG